MVITKLLRILLSVMSLASFLLGAGLSAVGIWIVSSKDKLRSILNLVDTSKLPEVDKHKSEVEAILDKYDVISSVGLAILVIGCFIAAISICGCLGAMLDLKMLLLVYFIITGVMAVSLLVCLIYFATLKARMADAIQKKLAELQEKFLISVVEMVRKPETMEAVATVTINFMHIMLKCCGVNSVGDARNSSRWLRSERRLTELAKEGVPFVPTSGDQPAGGNPLVQSQALPSLSEDRKIPDWLKSKLPKLAELPAGVSLPTELPAGIKVPAKLPPGFELPTDFAATLKKLVSGGLTADSLNSLFDNALTIRTPVTCCEISNSDELLKGKYDAKMVYQSMKDMSCAFSTTNIGVNQQTCQQALMDYISRYQHIVITVGTILTLVMGGGVFAAAWIFFCE